MSEVVRYREILESKESEKIRINGKNRKRERKAWATAERERWQSPRWQFLPSFFSPKAKEWSENEECFKWIVKVTEGTGGHICVGYLMWRDSHLQPHLGSNLHLTRIDSFCIFLLNPPGIKCICKCTGRFRVKREEGRFIFLSGFRCWGGPAVVIHVALKVKLAYARATFSKVKCRNSDHLFSLSEMFTGKEINQFVLLLNFWTILRPLFIK